MRKSIGKSVSKKTMLELGKQAVMQIVERTRRGFGVEKTDANKRKLKPLSQRYIEKRKRANNLSNTTTPKKSNLTFTGQLLRSMRVKQVSNRRVRWGPNKRIRKGGLTNERLGEIVSEERPFNFLSKQDIKKLSRSLDKKLTDALRKL